MGSTRDAQNLFDEMPHKDSVSWNSLVSGFSKRGDLGNCLSLFWAMPEQNTVSWNSMVAVWTQNGFPNEAVNYFNMMRVIGLFPDEATMVSLLQACENLPLGRLVEAMHEFFERTVREGLEPDHVTFTHLLSACSHSGLVKEGKYYFQIMSDVYKVQPQLDHYSCMVDLLGRCGLLNDAHQLIKNMPLEPNSGVWGALLGACRVYGNINLGKEAAENLIALNPSDPRNYIMLSNIYSAAGLWSDASKVRSLMKTKVLTRNAGCSFIEHGNKIHRFVVDDYSHPDSEKIHKKLEELMRKIQEVGFVSETESILHDVDEDVKTDMINKHSEKIALAYGLLVSSTDMPLVIIKNLRICRDCHNTAKFVSLIEKRTIIIRDSKRFHHFSDGLCSCGDYW
uniref:DYW domain-containing protein n=1 Tax=Cajanus cajan TaxID=3821 RepID=A0A151SPZ2_CAJCA|nr:hypothetical protein KK1_003161 [Cajanus cajan]